MGYALVFFFALVFGLVGGSAIADLLLAAYIFRPAQLPDVLRVLGRDVSKDVSVGATVGLWLACGIPVIAGAAYALSEASWMVQVFGLAGTYYWVWVAGAFLTGFVLGAFLRTTPET